MTAKEQIVAILAGQPDDSTYEELLRELVFAQMIDRGLADSDARRTVSHEEMEARISSWAK
jgi:predicted transcriptional regulator